MISCVRKGCAKQYLEGSIEDCYHHPGAPLFHEGLKSWSCCTKKIPGCTVGNHSNIIDKPDVQTPGPNPQRVPDAAVTQIVKESSDASKEVFDKLASFTDKKEVAAVKIIETELFDEENASILVNTTCKRPACGKSFLNDTSRTEECVFHSGTPIFHEGSKSWSCCPRKVLDFDEFLRIEGCKIGKHRFTDSQIQRGPVLLFDKIVVECKRDWYQTQDKVILSIFAKKINKVESSVEFKDQRLEVDIKFVDGSKHSFHTNLFQPIKPDESTFEFMLTKIELRLKKANGISWAAIEPNSGITSWTSFGIQGGKGGTVGGKDAIIASDSPVHLLK